MKVIAYLQSITLLFVISLTEPILAAPYPKTTSDFATLPGYCKIRYKRDKYPVEYKKLRKRFGQEWSHMHHYCKGLFYLNKGKFAMSDSEQRKSSFSTALDQFNYVQRYWKPNYILSPQVHVNKGKAMIGLGRINQALNEFKTAIKIKPKYSAPYIALSNFYLKIGDSKQAEAWLQKGIKMAPKSKNLKRKLLKLKKTN